MSKLIDLTGKRFGRLTVLGRDTSGQKVCGKHVFWRCDCDCGITNYLVSSQSLRESHTTSCGCRRRDKDPDAYRWKWGAEYNSWRAIKERCFNSRSKMFQHYGARGITMCSEWRANFEVFLAYVGPRPTEDHTVERIDVNGNYEPGNVKWADYQEQANNKRNTRYVDYRGERMSLKDAVRASGSVVHHEAVWGRITRMGWSLEQALETPCPPRKRRAYYGRKDRAA